MRVFGIGALALTLSVGVAYGQAGGAASPVAAPTGKAGYFANSDIQNIWKDLEARQVLNKRVLEGGTHSINVRIVTPKDAPLAHANSLDIWLVQAGSATAVTGGELLDAKKRPNSDDVAGSAIKGGTSSLSSRAMCSMCRPACRTASRTSPVSALFWSASIRNRRARSRRAGLRIGDFAIPADWERFCGRDRPAHGIARR